MSDTHLESYFSLFKELWKRFSFKRKKQIIFLAIFSSFSAFAELLSIGMIFPFLAALTDPQIILKNYYFLMFNNFYRNVSEDNIIFLMTLAFCLTIFLSVILRVAVYYFLTRISFSTGADICKDVMSNVIFRPYLDHKDENTSEVLAGIINKSNTVIYAVIVPILLIMSSVSVLLLFLSVLFLVSASATIAIGFITIALYSLLVYLSNLKLTSNSELIAKNQTLSIKSVQEALGSIRNLIMDGTGNFFHKRFAIADEITRYAQGTNMFIGASPKYIVEGFGIIIIAVLAFNFLESSYSETIIPILGLYALAAQKLLPISQLVYGSVTQIIGARESLIDILNFLKPQKDENLSNSNLSFVDKIELKNISFSYENEKKIIDDINLTINKGEKIGIIGSTGSGKSTLVDIISGLILSNQGDVLIDGVELKKENVNSWHKRISYVPQEIYLLDMSIKENIALGVDNENIKSDKLTNSIDKSLLNKFISEKGLQSIVGESGNLISGGQKQRIGIARAIYKLSDILILDEATSALDENTENLVIQELNSLENITMIIITHNPRILHKCNRIIELKEGKISSISDDGS